MVTIEDVIQELEKNISEHERYFSDHKTESHLKHAYKRSSYDIFAEKKEIRVICDNETSFTQEQAEEQKEHYLTEDGWSVQLVRNHVKSLGCANFCSIRSLFHSTDKTKKGVGKKRHVVHLTDRELDLIEKFREEPELFQFLPWGICKKCGKPTNEDRDLYSSLCISCHNVLKVEKEAVIKRELESEYIGVDLDYFIDSHYNTHKYGFKKMNPILETNLLIVRDFYEDTNKKENYYTITIEFDENKSITEIFVELETHPSL
ncbi:MAG: hypothetical protein ACFFC7_28255 [Candidatus Hermodarchaeota archaeon]